MTHILDPEEIADADPVKAARIEETHEGIEDAAPSYGIKETAECVRFLCMSANVAVNWQRFGNEVLVGQIGELISPATKALANIGEVPKELGDLQVDERGTLVQIVRSTLDLSPIEPGTEWVYKPDEKYGIEQTKDAVIFVGTLASYAVRYHKMNIGQIVASVVSLAPKFVTALSGLSEIPREMADMDEEDRVAIVSAFAESFDLDDDHAEELTEMAFNVLTEIADFINATRLSRMEMKSQAYEELIAEAFDATLAIVALVDAFTGIFDVPVEMPEETSEEPEDTEENA